MKNARLLDSQINCFHNATGRGIEPLGWTASQPLNQFIHFTTSPACTLIPQTTDAPDIVELVSKTKCRLVQSILFIILSLILAILLDFGS